MSESKVREANGTNELEEATQPIDAVAESSPDTKVTLSDGSEVVIYKCKTKQVGSVLRLMIILLDQMGIKRMGDVPDLDMENPMVLLQLIAKSTDNIFELASGLCSINDHAKFQELDFDDAFKIIVAEFQLNKDFFSKSVLPLIGEVRVS